MADELIGPRWLHLPLTKTPCSHDSGRNGRVETVLLSILNHRLFQQHCATSTMTSQ